MTRLRVVGAIGALIVYTSMIPAQGEDAEPGKGAALVRLAQPISVEMKDVQLVDALRFIEDSSGVALEVMWLDESQLEGLDPEALVSVRAREMSAIVLLERILRNVGDSFEGATWQLAEDEDAVQVGPRSRLNEFKRIEMYDLRDLVFILPEFRNAPQIDIEAALNQGAGGNPGNILKDNDDAGEVDQPLPQEVAQGIMDAIMEFIEPEQWIDLGGDGARMRLMDQTLVIKAPGYIHRRLVGIGE